MVENKGLELGGGEYSSPRVSSELPDCSMPMTFDHFNYCSLGCLYCVVAGTKIATPNGKQSIEHLNVGDTVYSKDIATGRIVEDSAISIMERDVNSILRITLEDGSTLDITAEHPVYVKGFGWKLAGELREEDDVDISKRPDVSFLYQSKANPMKNSRTAKKMSHTLKKRYASGELDGLKVKLIASGKRNITKYNKRDSTRAMVSARMKNDNPMRDKKTVAKVSATIKTQYKNGRVSHRLGKNRPDASARMLSDQNPMKNPEIRRATLRKIVKSWRKNGRVSKGEQLVVTALRALGYNFIHQCVVPGPKRDYIVDFMLPDNSVCIEYDGHSRHYTEQGKEQDKLRDVWIMNKMGVRTIRIHRDAAFIPQNDLQIMIKKQVEI